MTAALPIALLLLAAADPATSPAVSNVELGAPIADSAPVYLGVTLKMNHTAELDAFRKDQQDPASPDYHRWLSPEEFGARFGQPEQVYAQVVTWLKGGGFEVTEYPNRTFVEARGNAGQVAKLLGVRLLSVTGQSLAHVPDKAPELPAAFRALIQHISGLDTRVHYHHHMAMSGPVVSHKTL